MKTFIFCRELATISYRSGPEWQLRFGRKMNIGQDPHLPTFGPQFAIESYLDYQVGSTLTDFLALLLTLKGREPT